MKTHALVLALLVISCSAFAQTPAPELPATEPTDPAALTNTNAVDGEDVFIAMPTDTTPIEGIEASEKANNLITISLDDVAMVDVVRMFGRISNANIIATPSNLNARVTANLDSVEWRPALSQILSQHDLSMVERPAGSGIFNITPKQPDAPEPLVVKTIFLQYTTVNQVMPVVRSMLPANGKIEPFASRNALIVVTTANNLAEIEQVMEVIDIESKQVCVEAQFMELSDIAIKQLGIRWDSLGALGVHAEVGPFTYESGSEQINAREDGLSRNRTLSSSSEQTAVYDMYGQQIQSDPALSVNNVLTIGSEATSDITDTFAETITQSGGAILSMDTLDIVISALNQTDGVSIISNPKMIIANGATNAFFRVGSRDPIIKRTIKRGTQDSPGDEITAELDTALSTEYIKNGYLQTGIELKVVPTVKADDLIEAMIEPSLRRQTGEKVVDGNTWPIISVKEIKTRFTLESGQTVAIGGLTDTRDNKATSKVPLLGDIPLIGKYLFSHTRDEKSQVEIIIFVTLTLINPHQLNRAEAIPERGELVHKRLLQLEARKRTHDKEIKLMRQAAEVERLHEDQQALEEDQVEGEHEQSLQTGE